MSLWSKQPKAAQDASMLNILGQTKLDTRTRGLTPPKE
jgi:hypothetical protein